MTGIRKILLNLAVAVLVVFTGSVCAQTLNNVEVKSQVRLSRSELQSVLKPYVGREITIKTLQNLLNDLT
ncbi:POTRA domain-containing protein, ShlB-type, partial [Succinivibrio dextrinosolvens]|uniref:POTRA domain-containing protein n=1 Tax=Succinivibrio dextrinosolvens TaxID=83771 RepID=UPI0008E6FFAA